MEQQEAAAELSFEDKLALIVDRQHTWRQNLAFQQRLKRARLRGNACVEDSDYKTSRGWTKAWSADWHRSRHGFKSTRTFLWWDRPDAGRVIWLRRWHIRHAGTDTLCCTRGPRRCFATFPCSCRRQSAQSAGLGPGGVDVLVVDDWAIAPLAENEPRDFWEICEERYQTRSTTLTLQVPVANWHEQIGDATVPTEQLTPG